MLPVTLYGLVMQFLVVLAVCALLLTLAVTVSLSGAASEWLVVGFAAPCVVLIPVTLHLINTGNRPLRLDVRDDSPEAFDSKPAVLRRNLKVVATSPIGDVAGYLNAAPGVLTVSALLNERAVGEMVADVSRAAFAYSAVTSC